MSKSRGSGNGIFSVTFSEYEKKLHSKIDKLEAANKLLADRTEEQYIELNSVHTLAAEALAALPRISEDMTQRYMHAMHVFEQINQIYHASYRSEGRHS